jgi:N-acetyl-alpha-D-glucosaminyl L-malate synthase BshA
MERPLNVGIVCYASVGGSGVVATELGKALALRGHQVHFISTETPFRLGEFQEGLSFHQVLTPTYPLFREPQYLLSLANRIVQVAREFNLDIIHAHYAVPHATAAFLSQQVLAASGASPVPMVVTTLHGTDITLVGNDSSYSQIVAFSIQQSDSVTAVSASLRDSTYDALGIAREIHVIPNFLDCGLHRRRPRADLRKRFTGGDDRTKIVKRVDIVLDIFDRIRRRTPARLLLVGDGPDLSLAYRKARELGVTALVHGVGAQEEVVPLLSVSDVFLLPSVQESFGLAALEAMACEVPVVASRVGGIPEVIEDGVSGFLHPPDAVDDMAASALAILTDDELHARMGMAACRRVREQFCVERVVPMYEACYRDVLNGGATKTAPAS